MRTVAYFVLMTFLICALPAPIMAQDEDTVVLCIAPYHQDGRNAFTLTVTENGVPVAPSGGGCVLGTPYEVARQSLVVAQMDYVDVDYDDPIARLHIVSTEVEHLFLYRFTIDAEDAESVSVGMEPWGSGSTVIEGEPPSMCYPEDCTSWGSGAFETYRILWMEASAAYPNEGTLTMELFVSEIPPNAVNFSVVRAVSYGDGGVMLILLFTAGLMVMDMFLRIASRRTYS